MKSFAWIVLGILAMPLSALSQEGNERGNAEIRAQAGPSEIVIRTTARLAGAIDSLQWNGKEFINSTDHGRQLQSASNFDRGRSPFHPETFNPTEAGSRDDGAGTTSTSKLLKIDVGKDELTTTIQMAYWLAPGEKSLGHPALNEKRLSDHLLTKHVQIGYHDFPQAIVYDVTFTVPAGEHHTFAQFEALTGYMPEEFNRFWTFNPADGQLHPLSKGPGEQPRPVVVSTADGRYAMGVITFESSPKPGYGRFTFDEAHVSKWNCVFRIRDPDGIAPGDYRYRMFVAVGTLDDVRATLRGLHEEHARP